MARSSGDGHTHQDGNTHGCRHWTDGGRRTETIECGQPQMPRSAARRAMLDGRTGSAGLLVLSQCVERNDVDASPLDARRFEKLAWAGFAH